ncbi:C-C motif chemokine 3-like [Orycteropus afer afer]|uniref:C-C motif chemokine 3-like n=1 Tax=Orycteropus afer afer TaxID=1230840 RepID=A0AC54ZAI9_ORYAF|nr:C-C motif chemokine 3-like [Orycteropus afer afer]
MKVTMAALFILFYTMVFCFQESAQKNSVHTPTTCCFSYASRPLSHKQLTNAYFKTSSKCSKPGIIFFTKRGRYVCANPSDAWVQEYIRDLEQNS